MSSYSAPKVVRNGQNIQLSYDAPHRINTAITCPQPSPNGSKILIYGSDNGVRIIWRGGRQFKSTAPHRIIEPVKANGATSGAVMIIDSDDEGPTSDQEQFVDKPEFEDEEEEHDPACPYPSIVQFLDLALGTSVLSLAIASTESAKSHIGPTTSALSGKLVFVAGCADNSVCLITIPLLPPSPASKSREELRSSPTAANAGNGNFGETVTILSGHTAAVDGVAITFTTSSTANSSLDEIDDSRSRPPNGEPWQILVASHSRAVSGLLLLHSLSGDSFQNHQRPVTPFQTQFLSSPAVTISFKPSTALKAASPQLLLADKGGACKIYDCQISSSDLAAPPSFAIQGGTWLLTMLVGFQNNKTESPSNTSPLSLGNYGRKSIVDARWVLNGKAVLVLLADGEWGAWDIEGALAGPSRGVLGRASLKGAAITAFSISGWIDGAPTKSNSRSATQQINGKFAPMTPGTRKTVEPTLFSGRIGHGTAHGSISVASLPAVSTTNAPDECVTIWLEDSYVMIPNLTSFWESQRSKSVGSGSLFGASKPGSRVVKIEEVDLRGEKCCGIAQSTPVIPTRSALPTDLIIVGEHRFTIVMGRDQAPKSTTKIFATEVPTQSQALIPSMGDLDVTDIDDVLDRMEEASTHKGRKRIQFTT